MMEYILIRSKRRSIGLRITEEAKLEVRAPLKASKADIDHFLISNLNWINRHLTVMEQSAANRAEFIVNYNNTVPLQGREYQITAREGKRAGFDGDCFYLPSGFNPDEVKAAIVKVYKLLAKKLLTNKVLDYSKQMGVMPTAVKINGAKTRWGSCSSRNSINFSWRLVMAEDYVIDYVVVHELAHILEHNHSERFWQVVAMVLPDYKSRQKKLKELQRKLANEDWD
ncbi:M48 family metallopeptidase [Bacillota bacterium]